MKILGDPKITDATITITNLEAEDDVNKLKTFQLSDRVDILTDNTVITVDFGASNIPALDMLALCGTNLSENASIVLTYASVDIDSPDGLIQLDKFSNFNQLFLLEQVLQKRYLRFTISDNTLDTLSFGYLYVGLSITAYAVYPHTPALGVKAAQATTITGQEYGSKLYTLYQASWELADLQHDDVDAILQIVRERMNIEPVLVVEYEETYELNLYRPKYGVLTLTEYPYPMVSRPGTYNLELGFEERF